MSWAEIKKAINSNLSKPLNTLITESAKAINSNLSKPLNTLITESVNDLKYPNVQCGKLSTSYTKFTGKGKITVFMSDIYSSTPLIKLYVEIDGVNVTPYDSNASSNLTIGINNTIGIMEFSFEESLKIKGSNSLSYFVQLTD